MRFSMFNQIQIINYFKFVDQSNFTSIKSINSRKFNFFINCFCSTFRFCFSINRITKISQHQYIAIDETSDLKIQQKIKNRFSFRFFEQKYIVVADVNYINKDIRVETSLTNAKKYNSIKSSIKSIEKFKSIKFSIFINCFNSIFRICFLINQIAETSQYQHIAINKIKLLKSLKFIVIINSFNSTFRFSFSINHDSIISQMLILISSRIDFLRVLINQMIYVSIIRFSYRFSNQFAFLSFQTTIHRCRRRFHKHLNIRVETTLKKKIV